MEYHSSAPEYNVAAYASNSTYASNSEKPKYRIVGLCRGTCRTNYGCSCR